MLLDTLLARATAMPGLQLWRGLAPRRFFVENLLTEIIKDTTVLPADEENGLFAVLTTAATGLPEDLPEGWTEVANHSSYFATYRLPAGIPTAQVIEEIALALVPVFFPPSYYRQMLINWLQKELGDEPGAITGHPLAPAPDPLGPVRIIDIPSPRDYENIKTEEEQDLDFLYGNGRTPPEYRGYECAAQLDPTYGPPEVSDVAIQEAEEATFYFG